MSDKAHNIPVLMYHHVSAKHDSLTVTAKNFDRQIAGLAKHGYTSLGSKDLENFYAGKPLPKKSVLITFDDGYLNNWVYAHPVLKKYNMRALLFTITGLIGNGPVRPFNGQTKDLPHCPGHHQAKKIMFTEKSDDVMLRWSEIHTMVRDGTFEIHSHTHTHKRWDLIDKINKNEHILADLNQSRQILQAQLGQVSGHLCWPQGYFDSAYQQIANDCGFNFLYVTDARGQNTVASTPNYIYIGLLYVIGNLAGLNKDYGWQPTKHLDRCITGGRRTRKSTSKFKVTYKSWT